MNKIWLIASVTYRRRVRSGMFLILTFGLPLVMILAGVIPLIRVRSEALPQVGYVDLTRRLPPASSWGETRKRPSLLVLEDLAAAQKAFREKRISGYLVIPEGYFRGEAPVFYGRQHPSSKLEAYLAQIVREAALPDAPPWLLDRLEEPSEVTYVARESGLAIPEGPALIFRLAFPSIMALMFAFAILTGAGQMGAAVVREKEQRSMEMMITAVAPEELVAGKVFGMALLSLTQVMIWMLGGAVAIGLALLRSGELQHLTVPWGALFWALLLGIPGYFLYAVVAAGLGIIAGNSQQAQQLAGLMGFLGVVPLWFLGQLIDHPDGGLAVGLTIFPLTGPMVGLIRMTVAEVPAWQLGLSWVCLMLSLAGAVVVVGRVFRVAMLMYGQMLRPRQLWQAIQGGIY